MVAMRKTGEPLRFNYDWDNLMCHPSWFVGQSTVVLGGGCPDNDPNKSKTVAAWKLCVEVDSEPTISHGFLVIACERVQGGLHTQRRGATANVALNGNNRDLVGLKDTPPGHTDYFHRPHAPQLPEFWPISGCGTIYAWPVSPELLAETGEQIVTVSIDAGVAWDIDYVGLAFWKNGPKSSRLQALLHDWGKEIAIGIIATVAGGLLLLLFG